MLKCQQIDVSCGMFSDVISLVLRNCNTDSENESLIRLSVPDDQKTCSSKGVSLRGISTTWSDIFYHVEWTFPDQSIIREAERDA